MTIFHSLSKVYSSFYQKTTIDPLETVEIYIVTLRKQSAFGSLESSVCFFPFFFFLQKLLLTLDITMVFYYV